ncbi:hypothetical protein PsalN5692_00835 [Piscirickettsia salmonis]|uniref:hypothetical protein n=2 Tax=Piscirickettsia salmonis TaxID=1238 RepID=UPI0012B6CB36|nr:hypothetical protein PsalN5692_00835 [Piscirickettsia salmonis]
MRITARRTGHQIDFHFPDNSMTDIFLRHFPIEHGPQGRMPIRNANVLSFPCYTARSGDFVINFGSQYRRDHFIHSLREATNLRHYDALNWLLTSPPHGHEGEIYLTGHLFERENIDILISNDEPHFTHQPPGMPLTHYRTPALAPHRNPIPPAHHGAFATFAPPVNYGAPTAFTPQRMPLPSTHYRAHSSANTHRRPVHTAPVTSANHRAHTRHRPQSRAAYPTADHHRTVMPPPAYVRRAPVARATIATNQHTPTTRSQLAQSRHQPHAAPTFPDMTPVTFTVPAIAPANAIPARNVFILPRYRASVAARAAHEGPAIFAAYNHLLRVLSTLNSDSRIMEFIQRAMAYPDKSIARATIDYCVTQLAHPDPAIRDAIIAQMTIATGDCSTPIYDRLLELYIKMKIDKDEAIPADIFARAMLARAIERETEALGFASNTEAQEVKNGLLMCVFSASAVAGVTEDNPLEILAEYDLTPTTANHQYALQLLQSNPYICAAFKAWICDADGNFSPEKLGLKVEEERRLLIGELPFANGTYDELMTYCQEKGFLDITRIPIFNGTKDQIISNIRRGAGITEMTDIQQINVRLRQFKQGIITEIDRLIASDAEQQAATETVTNPQLFFQHAASSTQTDQPQADRAPNGP